MKYLKIFSLFLVLTFASFAQEYNSSYTGAEIDAGVRPYKVYTARLYQVGTSAPTPTILENTIGNIVWGYSTAGVYTATLVGAFTVNKTDVNFSIANSVDGDNSLYLFGFHLINSDSVVTIYTKTADATFENSPGANGLMVLSQARIEIRVYP